jgi:hypothetical protein
LVIIGSMLRDIWRNTMQPAEAIGLVQKGSLSLTKRGCLRIERVKENRVPNMTADCWER